MCIDLRGCNIFMTEHFLDGTKISATFYQMRGKAVTKCMWRNCFLYPCIFCQFFNNKKDHHPCKLASTTIEKKNILIALFYRNMYTNILKIDVHIFNCATANRYQSFFIAFTDNSYKTNIKI